jgi:hypothetical protein
VSSQKAGKKASTNKKYRWSSISSFYIFMSCNSSIAASVELIFQCHLKFKDDVPLNLNNSWAFFLWFDVVTARSKHPAFISVYAVEDYNTIIRIGIFRFKIKDDGKDKNDKPV